ncbi:HAD family hydrolase [Paenibacillus tepidiphilus]|uniref:HAD family hydrolase n=1 Tax=Paenibacillus tepidiphilus TaxID=2608683 RepID=UPI001239A83D|nr:HAD family hydrolase [Paenibacillus tepidiphilus]
MEKNVIFDFDGVIINSHEVQVKALQQSYRLICGEGEPPFQEFFRNSGDSLQRIFAKLDLPLSMIPIYQQVSRENIASIQIYPGMRELLQEIRNYGIPCALCTGKDRSRTLEILKHHRLGEYFDFIVCSDDVHHPKPHRESIDLILTHLQLAGQDSVMIGDGINDIVCARNAGIQSIAVSWGDVSKEELRLQQPTLLVETVEELRDAIFNGGCLPERIPVKNSVLRNV